MRFPLCFFFFSSLCSVSFEIVSYVFVNFSFLVEEPKCTYRMGRMSSFHGIKTGGGSGGGFNHITPGASKCWS